MNSNVTACPWSLNELMAKITDKEGATYTVHQLYAVSIGVYKLVLVKLMGPICSLYSTYANKKKLTKNEAAMWFCQPLPMQGLLSVFKMAVVNNEVQIPGCSPNQLGKAATASIFPSYIYQGTTN